MEKYKKITFFTGSAKGTDKAYEMAVKTLAQYVASQNMAAVYGGGKVGLMGVLADTFTQMNTPIVGVMPQQLVNKELAHPKLDKLIIVDGMHARKQKMVELGDAFVALPGGCGTLEEFFEVLTWQQLGLHTKPVALYNVNNFWGVLLDFLESLVGKGFMGQEYYEKIIVSSNPEDLIQKISAWTPTTPKWTTQLPT